MKKKPKLEEAFATLVLGLQAAKDFSAGEADQRWGALSNVVAFLDGTLGDKDLLLPLERLCDELEPRRGRTMTHKEVEKAATCLAAIDALVFNGHPVKAAIGKVCEASGDKVDDARLENWRKNLKKRGNRGVRGLYASIIDHYQHCDPVERQRLLLQAVADLFEKV